jgi:hypothetical protein
VRRNVGHVDGDVDRGRVEVQLVQRVADDVAGNDNRANKKYLSQMNLLSSSSCLTVTAAGTKKLLYYLEHRSNLGLDSTKE